MFSAFRCLPVYVECLQYSNRVFREMGGATMRLAKINDTTLESILVIFKESWLAVACII